jgi:Spy/CpxP family protein refolding chaperone
LSADQRDRIKALFDAMKAEAVPIGAKLIDQEAALDKQFASRTVTLDSLKAATAAVAATQGELRETHLKYHLSTANILNPGQMQRYVELRGYTATVNIKSAITTDPMKPSQAGFRYP